MAERQSLESYITQAEQAVEYAKEQLDQGMRQEHYNTMEYSDAQLQLEQAYNDLQTMQQHANDEQREQLNRAYGNSPIATSNDYYTALIRSECNGETFRSK